MLGVIGLLAAMALLVFLAYKGVAAIPAALISSLVVVLTNGLPLWDGFASFFMGGFGAFIGGYFLVFATSALFARAMADSGSAQKIAYKFLDWFGAKRAVLVMIATTAVLTYGGVSLFVVIFAVYPIALVLWKEADLPKRMLPGIIAFGAATFTMSALPASPQLTNLIPTQVLGTSLTAGAGMGIFASILIFGAGYYYFVRMERKVRALGEGFVAGPKDDLNMLADVDQSKLPSTVIAFIPMAVILIAIVALRNMFAPVQLVVYAMVVATILVFVFNWSRLDDKRKTINDGLMGGTSIINVAVIIGFGAVVQNTEAFQVFVQWALGLQMHPYLSAVVATEVVAGITGSSSGGLTIFLNALGAEYIALGANPEILHRLVAIAAGGLDTLPHSGGIFLMMSVVGLTHKEGYWPIFITTVVIPVIVAFICAFIAIAIY